MRKAEAWGFVSDERGGEMGRVEDGGKGGWDEKRER